MRLWVGGLNMEQLIYTQSEDVGKPDDVFIVFEANAQCIGLSICSSVLLHSRSMSIQRV